jgi:hypothetical protein
MTNTWHHALAGLTALIAAIALSARIGLTIHQVLDDGGTLATAVVRFASYFTNWAVAAVAAVAGSIALVPNGVLAGGRARLAVVTGIVLVALIYSLVLRAEWSPTGLEAVIDHGLHDVVPPLFLVVWLLGRHGVLAWRDAPIPLVLPLAYCLVVYARGAVDGWYPYFFLNPGEAGGPGLALNLAGLAAAFVGIGVGFVALDRWLGRQRRPAPAA